MDAPDLALRDTVVSFPPKGSIGPAFFFEVNRGPILPPVGSKWRDQTLRQFDRHSYNSMWQGARSGIVKKLASIPWEIKGPQAKAQYYQDLLGYSQFGHGWEYLLKLVLTDFLTQSYGGIFEIAGPGDPNTPLLEAPTGINHLDAIRCYVTGNPIFPLLYYSLWDGKLHRMHASRVYMMVDDPMPDERYFGIGTSALERAIAISQREMRMGQYIDALLDDKPQPGLLSLTGVSDANWQMLVNKYIAEVGNDELGPFGKVIVMTSLDPNAEVKVQVVPFSQTPEKFDYIKYTDLDVSALALAFGVDRQELWELAGRGLGSGSQSGILAIKSRSKLYGDTLNALERFMNWAILPDDCEFVFKEKDQMQDQVQAGIDVQIATAAQSLLALGISKEAIGKFLIDQSPSYSQSLTDDQGQVSLTSEDPKTPAQIGRQEVALDSNTPLNATGAPMQSTATAPAALPAGAFTPLKPAFSTKSFAVTSADFRTRFADILQRTIEGRLRPTQAENLMLSLLLSSGTKAFQDGLLEGGVSDEMSDDDDVEIQSMVADAIDYVDPLLTDAQAGNIAVTEAPGRAEMWVNKTLTDFFNAGRISADRDGMYMWALGKTEEHCTDCVRLNGQVHRFGVWYSKGWIPQSDRLECHGFQCQCTLNKTDLPAQGRF